MSVNCLLCGIHPRAGTSKYCEECLQDEPAVSTLVVFGLVPKTALLPLPRMFQRYEDASMARLVHREYRADELEVVRIKIERI